jgi:hypothetical protein
VRLRSLLALLAMSVLTALLVRVPLTAVPTYESGVVVAAAASALVAWIAARRARTRRAPELRWGVLARAPGDEVLGETARNLRLGLALVALPLPALVSEAFTSGCRAFVGLPSYLFAALPAIVVGGAAGTLAGSLCRRASRASALLVAAVVASVAADVLEFAQGGRMFVHDVVLGPLTSAGVTGHDQGLGFPASASWHRAWAVLLAAIALQLAVLARCRLDAPALPEGETDATGDGWRDSRSSDPVRLRFLLRHESRRTRLILVPLLAALLPFLALHERAGILGGRDRFAREMPEVVSTPHFRIHYAAGSAAEAQVERVAVELEAAREEARQWIGVDPPWVVDAWLHPDAETQFRLTGARGFVFAVPWRHEFHVSSERGRLFALRHELLHVLVADQGLWPFRVSLSMGMTEGLATALDEGYARHPEVHQQVAAAAAAGFVPPASNLLNWRGFSGGTTDQSYRASASFVGWLLRAKGARAVMDAYRWGDVAKHAGASMDELDAQWRAFLRDEVPVAPQQRAAGRERFDPSRRPAFRKTPCSRLGPQPDPEGRERGDLFASEKLHDAAADAYCEAAGWREDPEILESAAWERVRAGRRPEALALVRAALARTEELSTRREGLLRLQARLLVALDRRDDAAAVLKQWRDSGLSEWPDEIDIEERGLLDPSLGAAFADALLSPGGDATSRLGALLHDSPDFAPAVNELLLRLGTSRPVTRDRLALALQLARLAPGPLAARRVLDFAHASEEELAWDRARELYELASRQPRLPAVMALEAEDGLLRARWAPGVRIQGRRLRRSPQATAPDAEPAPSGAFAQP